MNNKKLKMQLAEKMVKERISKDVKKQFESVKSDIYKELWNNDFETKTVIETPLETPIFIFRGRISFDNEKTYIHRSEEKLIKEKLDKVEKDIVEDIFIDILSNHEKYIKETETSKKSRVEKARVEKSKIEDEHDLFNEFLSMFGKLPKDDKDNLAKIATLLLELNVINEQIELLKETGGDKVKLLALLEDKHSLLKELKQL